MKEDVRKDWDLGLAWRTAFMVSDGVGWDSS